MTRVVIRAAAMAAAIALAASAAHAQSTASKGKSPAELAAASEVLAEKYESCRNEAKQQHLSFVKQKLYVHRCVKK